jgi:hypothetical protein
VEHKVLNTKYEDSGLDISYTLERKQQSNKEKDLMLMQHQIILIGTYEDLLPSANLVIVA